jgi:phosphoglycerol transferase MdoB-like AlkP superfamily enzyme
MTVSNHRPFTYPDGKIDIPSDAKMREGGVKYTDYALKQFFTMAEKQPWFFNTVFVIVADHCASSSGKTELPVDKYHIPAMIYAPGFIEAKNVPTVMSQIDLMPTLFGLLHFNYESKFFGQDVFKDNYYPRALIATYEDLGYIENNTLTLISPVRKQKQFELKVIPNPALDTEHQLFYEEVECKKIDAKLLNATTSYYQTAAYMLQNHQYQQLN